MLQLGSSVKILEVSMSATVLCFQCALIKKTWSVANLASISSNLSGKPTFTLVLAPISEASEFRKVWFLGLRPYSLGQRVRILLISDPSSYIVCQSSKE